MRQDEDAFLRGEIATPDLGSEMVPCDDTAFLEQLLHENVLESPIVAPSRPFSRNFYCHGCRATTPHQVDGTKATCSVCSRAMDVVEPIQQPQTPTQMVGHRPFRVGESVKAREGTKLYRYLKEFFHDPNIALKIESSTFFRQDTGYDYLVRPVSMMRKTWVQNQAIPVEVHDIFGTATLLSEVEEDEPEVSWVDQMENELLELNDE